MFGIFICANILLNKRKNKFLCCRTFFKKIMIFISMRKPLTPEQKEARKQYMKEWREANKEHLAKWYRNYRKENPEVNKTNTKNYRKRNPETAKASSKTYKANNKKNVNAYRIAYKKRRNELEVLRRKTDPLYNLKNNIRGGINKAFSRNGFKKNSRTHDIIGCTYEELKSYLESKFLPWMNWNNQGKYNGTLNHGWDIDHIVPISTAKTEEDVIRLSHYSNLQPLCSKVNRDIKRNNRT